MHLGGHKNLIVRYSIVFIISTVRIALIKIFLWYYNLVFIDIYARKSQKGWLDFLNKYYISPFQVVWSQIL